MDTLLLRIPENWIEIKTDFFARPAALVAKDLLGHILLVKTSRGYIGGVITETEAYDQNEEASHSFKGINDRNRSMFEESGTIYVYRSYGIHWCMNLSTGAKGQGEAVLIRALQAKFGAELMLAGASASVDRICSGPGRLCAALSIDKSFDGSLLGEKISIWKVDSDHNYESIAGSRIGITKAVDLEWRFGLKGHPSLSKPFPKQKGSMQKKVLAGKSSKSPNTGRK